MLTALPECSIVIQVPINGSSQILVTVPSATARTSLPSSDITSTPRCVRQSPIVGEKTGTLSLKSILISPFTGKENSGKTSVSEIVGPLSDELEDDESSGGVVAFRLATLVAITRMAITAKITAKVR